MAEAKDIFETDLMNKQQDAIGRNPRILLRNPPRERLDPAAQFFRVPNACEALGRARFETAAPEALAVHNFFDRVTIITAAPLAKTLCRRLGVPVNPEEVRRLREHSKAERRQLGIGRYYRVRPRPWAALRHKYTLVLAVDRDKRLRALEDVDGVISQSEIAVERIYRDREEARFVEAMIEEHFLPREYGRGSKRGLHFPTRGARKQNEDGRWVSSDENACAILEALDTWYWEEGPTPEWRAAMEAIRDGQSHIVDNNAICTRNQTGWRPGTFFCYYSDCPSKISGAPFCLKFEARVIGTAANRRLGLHLPRDLGSFGFHEYWAKHPLDLYDIDFEGWSRNLANQTRGEHLPPRFLDATRFFRGCAITPWGEYSVHQFAAVIASSVSRFRYPFNTNPRRSPYFKKSPFRIDLPDGPWTFRGPLEG